MRVDESDLMAVWLPASLWILVHTYVLEGALSLLDTMTPEEKEKTAQLLRALQQAAGASPAIHDDSVTMVRESTENFARLVNVELNEELTLSVVPSRNISLVLFDISRKLRHAERDEPGLFKAIAAEVRRERSGT